MFKETIANVGVAGALLLASLTICLAQPSAEAPPPVPVGSLIFQDTFSGPLNSTAWNPFITDNPAAGAPWNYQASQPNPSSAEDRPDHFGADYDLPSFIHTAVPGAGLVLADRQGATATGYSWTGSVICSYPNAPSGTKGFTFDDAYVEIRAKMPEDLADGGWPAIWFLAAPGSHGQEIDLFEGGFTKSGAATNHIMATTLQNYGPNGAISQVLTDTGVDLGAAYHTYGIAYKSGKYIKCYLDGKLVASWTGSRMKPNKFNGSYYMILNNSLATSATQGWHSQIDSSTPDSDQVSVTYVKAWALKQRG